MSEVPLTGFETKAEKITRKRKPWVYLSEYERLQNKYTILSYIAWGGWIAFLVTLKFVG